VTLYWYDASTEARFRPPGLPEDEPAFPQRARTGAARGGQTDEARAAAAARLRFLGVALDQDRNASAAADADISAGGAGVRTLVLTAREDLEIARDARSVLTAADS